MKPPFELTPLILRLLEEINQQLGAVKALHLAKPSPQLRKSNRIKTIQGSLGIEGNTLTQEQITLLLENKRVIGPKKDITEVINALNVYEDIRKFKPFSMTSFLKAHTGLMETLVPDAGKLRTGGVGIVKGNKVAHLAPPATLVKGLIKDLFSYLIHSKDPVLIKSCVFHYEIEFIHPFSDGNGRMGRFWQAVILLNAHAVFEFVPVESIIFQNQKNYYKALAKSDKAGQSTPFIEFMLTVINETLADLLLQKKEVLSDRERLTLFMESGMKKFARKDYLLYFKSISTATASRDLNLGVTLGILKKTGEKNKAVYHVNVQI